MISLNVSKEKKTVVKARNNRGKEQQIMAVARRKQIARFKVGQTEMSIIVVQKGPNIPIEGAIEEDVSARQEWGEKDDALLVELYERQTAPKDIATVLHRSVISVTARAAKLRSEGKHIRHFRDTRPKGPKKPSA